ncbi:Holliday junction resolvase RuvX [Guggenheimella bovis]
MRWLGLDIGDVRIGLSTGTNEQKIAFPHSTLHRTTRREDERAIQEIIEKEQIDGIVYGLPRHMTGELSEQAEKTEKFMDKLLHRLRSAGFSGEVHAIDERLTSVQAERSLLAQDMSRKKRKDHIDAIAASIILQTFLDQKKENKMVEELNKEELEEMEEEFEAQEIELLDDEGNPVTFVILDWFNYDDKLYCICVESGDDEDDGVLFRVEEDGEEMNFITPDEEEFEEVSAYYEELE